MPAVVRKSYSTRTEAEQLERADGYARRVIQDATDSGMSIHELVNPIKPFVNASTGREPGAGNTAVLAAVCAKNGFEGRVYATRNHIENQGGQIKKGEKPIWLISMRQEHELVPKRDASGAPIINPENQKPDLIRVAKMFFQFEKDGVTIARGPDGMPIMHEAPKKFYPFGAYIVGDQTEGFQPKVQPLDASISSRVAPSVRAVWDSVRMDKPETKEGREFAYDFGTDTIIVPGAQDVRDPRPQTMGAYHLACCLALAAAHPKRLNIPSIADGDEYNKNPSQSEAAMFLAGGMILKNHCDEKKIDWEFIKSQGESQISKWMHNGEIAAHAAIGTADRLYRHIVGISHGSI